MRKIAFLGSLFSLLSLFLLGCYEDSVVPTSGYVIPFMNHDLSYIPHDAKLDKPDYIICDSTEISSGRNRLKYIGGTDKLRKDITSKYLYSKEYESFSGYIIIRFLVNCEGVSGRYRAQSLGLDFSPLNAPSDLVEYAKKLIKSLGNWTRFSVNQSDKEYSKFINLKIENGKIQHVIL